MNKKEFLDDPDVILFVNWLVRNLPKLPVYLRVKASRFVSKSVEADVVGIEAVLKEYQWKSSGMKSGDWVETKQYLDKLAKSLRNAVAANDQVATLRACKDTLTWGGNRNWATGAYPFLNGTAPDSPSDLCQYLRSTGEAFELTTADSGTIAPPVTKMNSMLTKVHALYAEDGLPIYDSRVAAAIASLVECWRVDSNLAAGPLPSALEFPATLPTRTVFRLFPGARHHPGVMAYGANKTPADWSSAKIRLGWVMEAVLSGQKGLFAVEGAMSNRMHAFEASLFVIGYDVACLHTPTSGKIDPRYKTRVASLLKTGVSAVPKEGSTTIRPLREQDRDKDIRYTGALENGFDVYWGDHHFNLSPGDMDEILSEFGGMHDVRLGAGRPPSHPPEGSLGRWLENTGWSSSQYASAIAAILRHEGVISSHRGVKPIYLTFA